MKYAISAVVLLAGLVAALVASQPEAAPQNEAFDAAKAHILLQEDAVHRSNAMITELKALCEKYKCDLVPKVTIQGDRLSSEVVVTPRQ